MPLCEDKLLKQFGESFVNEVKILRNKKFVYVPVGASRQSVLEILP